jgi:biopolymer transport protein ExbB
MPWIYDITTLFTRSGLTRWPLLVCSVVGLAVIIERSFYYWRIRFDHAQFSRDIFILLRQNQLMKAIHLCQECVHPVADVAGSYLKNLNNRRRDSILGREGTLAIEKVERRLRVLAIITHVAPLLGLLGTVAGLVTAFHQIEVHGGQVQAQQLAGGIWEALLSTVFGLTVAIPCMVAYHTFESRADKTARQIQAIVAELDGFFGNLPGKDFKVVFSDKVGVQNSEPIQNSEPLQDPFNATES